MTDQPLLPPADTVAPTGPAGQGEPLPGLMQPWPMTLDRIIDHGAKWHADRAIITHHNDGSVSSQTFAALRTRAKRISAALIRAGMRPGDRIATLASNHADHLAAWYGIMGIGAVCHTLNPRLHADQLAYIVNHAGDRMIMTDGEQGNVVRGFLPRCPAVETVIRFDEDAPGGDWPTLDSFIGDAPAVADWGGFPEDTGAGLCYTSGTTGNPKGVLYSHRSNFLHALNTLLPEAFGLSARDVAMPVVPMFHANSWGLAFSTLRAGCTVVMPGARLDGASLYRLITTYQVTVSAGVPTVWQGLIDHCRREGITSLPMRRVIIGGSACPESLVLAFRELGVEVVHAWGMTELSPIGLMVTPTPEIDALPDRAQHDIALKQGRPIGIDMAIIDDDGVEQPHDGATPGRLVVRGPNVAERYLGDAESALLPGGWFDTGDIATIDAWGNAKITDRAKDIIKSGGEWISSVDIENAMLGHPAVALAAVVAMPDPKWAERPKLYLQLRPGATITADEARAHLAPLVAKWWLPDAVEVIDCIPLGATGKIDKKALRALATG